MGNGGTGFSKKQKLAPLQALRGLAFLGIFCCHAGVSRTGSWSAWGVSVFLVLSGFLLMGRETAGEVSAAGSGRFAFSRLRRIYGLHILTMLAMAGLLFFSGAIGGGLLLRELVLDALLLQAWVPYLEYTVSLNGPAWYLSVALFCYAAFPYLRYRLREMRRPLLLLPVITAVQLLLAAAVYGRVEMDTFIWFTYCCPLFRLGDFLAGCAAGQWFWNIRGGKRLVTGTAAELFAVAAMVALLGWLQLDFELYRARVLSNWTTLYIVAAVAAVVMFATAGGMLTRALSNRGLVFLGDVSGPAFLIHFVLLQAASMAVRYCGEPSGAARWLFIGAVLLATVVLSALWQRPRER